MNNEKLISVDLGRGKKILLTATVLVLSLACHKSNVNEQELRNFTQVNLIANAEEYHPLIVDRTLINAFGIAWTPNRIAWVNSVGGHVSELYSANGDTIKRVHIPSSASDSLDGLPCGIVASGGKGFRLASGTASFLFTGFDGVLSGWNPVSGASAQFLKHPPGASYTGLAIGSSGGHNFIYAANFGQSKIDVWDTAFTRIQMSFTDPALPDGYSPYNIQAVGDQLFVMYSVLGSDGHPVAGPGKGFVSVFNTNGSFVTRFASRGILNIPWGITMAPGSFLEGQDIGDDSGNKVGKSNTGSFNNNPENHDTKDPVILIGNFGDGRINVFSLDGRFLGQLQSHKQTIVIDGLWSLSFAPSTTSPTTIDPTRLYFTAGPEKETDGIFGYLTKQ